MSSPSTIDDLELLTGPVGRRAGAALLLREKPPRSAAWLRDDGWTVAISSESRYVVASGGEQSDYRQVWTAGYNAALQALDIWSYRGIADLTIVDPHEDHLAFWDSPTGSVVRIVGREPIGMSITATIVASGSPQPPPPPEAWHESMRFYRLAQTTDDLHDSTRNLWLAMENLLDDRIGAQQPRESEEHWLRRCLQTAEAHINIRSYLPTPFGSGTPKEPHNAAYAYFYDELRTDLFHAKASRQPRLPQQPEHVGDLSERHYRLTRLYLNLLQATVGTPRAGGGGMAYGGFEGALESLSKSPRLLLTNESAPFDPKEVTVEPPGREVVDSPAHRDSSLERPGLGVLLGRMSGAEVEQLNVVTRMMLEVEGQSAIALLPEGRIGVRGVDHVEAQLGIFLRNRREPKEFPP